MAFFSSPSFLSPSVAGVASLPSSVAATSASAGFSGSFITVGAANVAITKSLPIIVGVTPSSSLIEDILKLSPISIPSRSIIINLDGIEIGESFKISSINLEEGVTPTIIGRDFVIATLAAPTVMKEPEKPAEEATEEAAADGKDAAPAADGDKKEGEEKKAPEEKK